MFTAGDDLSAPYTIVRRKIEPALLARSKAFSLSESRHFRRVAQGLPALFTFRKSYPA